MGFPVVPSCATVAGLESLLFYARQATVMWPCVCLRAWCNAICSTHEVSSSVLMWTQVTIERPGAPAVTATAPLPQHMAALFQALGWSPSSRASVPDQAPDMHSPASAWQAPRRPFFEGPEPDQAPATRSPADAQQAPGTLSGQAPEPDRVPRLAAHGHAAPPAAPLVAELPAHTETGSAAWDRSDAVCASMHATGLVGPAGPGLGGAGDVLPAARGSQGAAEGDPQGGPQGDPRWPMNRRERRRGIVARRRAERAGMAAAAAQGAPRARTQRRPPGSLGAPGGQQAVRAMAAPQQRNSCGSGVGPSASVHAHGASSIGIDAEVLLAAGGGDEGFEPDGLGAYANRCTGAALSRFLRSLCAFADRLLPPWARRQCTASDAPFCMQKHFMRAHLLCLLGKTPLLRQRRSRQRLHASCSMPSLTSWHHRSHPCAGEAPRLASFARRAQVPIIR